MLVAKYFVSMCRDADEHPDKTYVLVIDELSRGDPGRVFGEALTYVEKSKRGLTFSLASGGPCVVPPNLVILATMNPFDRGVDEVDAAFERRFAKIAMEPDRNILTERLIVNGVPEILRRRIVGFFDRVNGLASTNPQGTVGHTYFGDVVDEASLRRVWDHQLRFLLEKSYRLDPDTLDGLRASFEQIFEGPAEQVLDAEDEPPATE
jgi:5-methylcytosine-specific restriction protein B